MCKTIASIHPIAAAACALVQAKKDVRSYLNGIYIEPRKDGGVTVVGSDGHRLLAVIDREVSVEGDKGIIVALDPTTVAKCKQKKADVLEIRDDGTASIPGLGHIAAYGVVDGKYPNWRAVLPKEAGNTSLGYPPALNPLYLADFGTVGKLLANGKYPGMRLHTRGPHDVVAVSFSCHFARLTASGCIMPAKFEAFAYGVE